MLLIFFSKWTEAFAVPDQTAITCANKIFKEIITRFGSPLDIHSDQGRNYESKLFGQLCHLLEIRKTRTSPRHPECNGQTERFNKTLIPMIRSYIKGEQQNWDLHLAILTSAYRATTHETTGFTPNMIMLGKEVRIPGEVLCAPFLTQEPPNMYGEYVDELRSKLRKAHNIVRKHMNTNAERQQDCYDGKRPFYKYKLGDYVWYLHEIRQEGISPKLQLPYTGPGVIVKKLNDLDYMIQMKSKGPTKVVHHNKLKPYAGNITLKWAKTAIQKANM